MIVAIKLSAPNDNNGNPRRLYVVYGAKMYSERLDIIDEGYMGTQALRKPYPDAVLLDEVSISPAEYRRWIKVGENDRKLRAE